MSTPRYYYINADSKVIRHYPEKEAVEPQGFTFAGMSEMPPKSAAGFYAKNQQGYSVVASETLIDDTPADEPEAEASDEEE